MIWLEASVPASRDIFVFNVSYCRKTLLALYLSLYPTSLTDQQIKDFLNTLRDFVYHDISSAISGNANYLAAMGLSVYTEQVGGLSHQLSLHGMDTKVKRNRYCNSLLVSRNYFISYGRLGRIVHPSRTRTSIHIQ